MHYLKTGAAKLGIELSPTQLEQFSIYYKELIEWNRRVNLTSITDFKEVQIKHFLDSLSVTPALKHPIDGRRFLDVGAGGGFPGLPLKIAFPAIKLVLLEATTKKAAFLRHLAEKLGFDDVYIVVGRAEDIARQSQYRECFDVVLSRAVAQLPVLAELTLPFCAVGGRLISQKKGDINAEIDKAIKAIEIMGGIQPLVKRVELDELADERYLLIVDKIAPTPDKYPRRPGIPAKRPIV
ncbi:MAG: 16S rRNA (guanine(527)-N(7))-methyltransferase RsmG [Dehalococcoidales bacterium]|nr:16S rRNA (guanine(527)-N(7))-methyltransferase RsmG [Dehalococcoidales bacterium]